MNIQLYVVQNQLILNKQLNLLKSRGKAMQNAVPKGEGGMIAIFGVEIDEIK